MTVDYWAIILCSFVCLVLAFYIVCKRGGDKGFWAGVMFCFLCFYGSPFIAFIKGFVRGLLSGS